MHLLHSIICLTVLCLATIASSPATFSVSRNSGHLSTQSSPLRNSPNAELLSQLFQDPRVLNCLDRNCDSPMQACEWSCNRTDHSEGMNNDAADDDAPLDPVWTRETRGSCLRHCRRRAEECIYGCIARIF
ncbi:unnamed protein product [Protopolystoma xenopodis]|uniref:Uncharacterized protein n=1 Tax=Protopolystoma xenopodis TaxID=117903 RepID=A0A448WXL0_9PLAT|nr:unnamed protein product [Protopolystoma xenopodis]